LTRQTLYIMFLVDPKEISVARLHGYILSSVAPRPIALASTISSDGQINLSPFSFFNAFGANPPILIFSPARRVRDNTTKHTLENIKETKEVVINVVSHSMVHQQSLASTEYEKGVNEFVKSGFTAIASEKVKPFRVKESPVQFECVVKQIIETGTEGGAGNLIICEIVLMHIDESILNDKQTIDQQKIDLVSRLGEDWYCRASGDSLFRVAKPMSGKGGIGFDQLPDEIKNSRLLTGNELGQLANIERIPDTEEIKKFIESEEYKKIISASPIKLTNKQDDIHIKAKLLLAKGQVDAAWKYLLADKMLQS